MESSMTDSAIAVFTGKTASEIMASGGSRSWLLSARNARKQRYLVCVRNAQSNDPGATEPHGTAFLLGEISAIMPLADQGGVPRWQISISGYARINQPNVWKNWRNPVKYTSLGELGIGLDGVEFTAIESEGDSAVRPQSNTKTAPTSPATKLTIDAAKEGLAAMFGVSPEAIEIIIRG
jgi:hypothetical protein